MLFCSIASDRKSANRSTLLTLVFVCRFIHLSIMCASVSVSVIVKPPSRSRILGTQTTISSWTVTSESNTEIKIQDTRHDTSSRFNAADISSPLACVLLCIHTRIEEKTVHRQCLPVVPVVAIGQWARVRQQTLYFCAIARCILRYATRYRRHSERVQCHFGD